MKLIRYLARCFVSGLLALLPLAVTLGLLAWLGGFIFRFVGPRAPMGRIFEALGLSLTPDSRLAYLLGWVLTLGFVFLLGVIVERGARKYIAAMFDRLMGRIPLVGNVYSTTKKLVDMVDKKDDTDMKAMSVILCKFGGDRGAAFLALLPSPEIVTLAGAQYRPVLIPSAPVPVGGSLILVPADSVSHTDISVDAFMSIYVSMGVTAPQFLPVEKEKTGVVE